MKKRNFLILAVCVMALVVSSLAVFGTRAGALSVSGEMVEIRDDFSTYLVQDTKRVEDDGYVGALQYTVYYDAARGTVKTGYDGTPIVIYAVNTATERIGTDSNKAILQSMLDRGYVVIVLDYLGNEKATGEALAYSAGQFYIQTRNAKHFTAGGSFPSSGTYYATYLVPSGYNLTLDLVFWEIDKHSTAGTLEKIVENWNSDFKATKAEKFVKWVYADGTRKKTASVDGQAPIWYADAAGKTVDAANGQYTKVKYTVAESFTDCVNPDGSPFDMNLYMHIVYPTNPEKEVPVAIRASSSGHLTTSNYSSDVTLPHLSGFLFDGYAEVNYDYLWVPMAANLSFGYYDGSQGVTKDHMNYGVHMYNDKLVNTAAMRYIRYLAAEENSPYRFDKNAFGVYGNSKGGWFSYLGEDVVQRPLVEGEFATAEEKLEAIDAAVSALPADRVYDGHFQETRYQAGEKTYERDVYSGEYAVAGGERQPWLTYPDGSEIPSGCQLTYPSNGSCEEDITAGHTPIFQVSCMFDDYNAAYGYTNNLYNIARELDIPFLWYEALLGHTLTWGTDMNYGADTWLGLKAFCDYYLKHSAVQVAYTDPMNKGGNISVTSPIELKFTGTVLRSEIEKIRLTAGGETVDGTWISAFGGTSWTFLPTSLKGGTGYTLTIPADFSGDNGVPMGEAYTVSFLTEYDRAADLTSAGSGYYTLKAPAFTEGNRFVFRFAVGNDAANVMGLYAVSSVGETNGTLLGKALLRGAGSYEIDVTDHVAAHAGEDLVLYLKAEKAEGQISVINESFDSALPPSTSGNVAYLKGAQIGGEQALGLYVKDPSSYGVSTYYSNPTQVFVYTSLTGGSITPADLGRLYTIEMDVYDTTSRELQIRLNHRTNRVTYGTIDYDHVYFNVVTEKDAWKHISFTYRVYEADYGVVGQSLSQSMTVYVTPDGTKQSPIYFNDLKVREQITGVEIKSAAFAEKKLGDLPGEAPVSASPFAVCNGETKVGEYASLKAAFAAFKSGYTIKAQSNYTLTDADLYDGIGGFETVNLDLGGYTIRCENTKNSLLWAKAAGANNSRTIVNLTGGRILLGRTPLISYENSTAAGAGKNFLFRVSGTTFGMIPRAATVSLISDTALAGSAEVKSQILLSDCFFDLPDSAHAYDAMTVFAAPAAATLDLSYTVSGGRIALSSQRWISVSDDARIVEYVKDENGEYTKLVLPSSDPYPISGSYLNENGYATYTAVSEQDNLVTYEQTTGENSTRYGIIPDNYADAQAYPFVLFQNGVCTGGYADIKAVITAASNLLSGADKADAEAEILLRRDTDSSTEPTYGASNGTLIFDLGGHTLKRTKMIINACTNSTTPLDYPTTVIFRNGRLETPNGCIAATHCLFSSSKTKIWNFTFENVTFGFADSLTAASVSEPFWTIWQNNHSTRTVTNITLNDCTIDLSKNTPANGGRLYTLSTALAECNLRINGGQIVGNGEKFTLASTDAADTVVFGKNTSGEYTTFVPQNGGKPLSETFLCDDGVYRNFQAKGDGYVLEENPLVTPYGAIPDQYASAEDYPFVVFGERRNFIGAFPYFLGSNGGNAAMNAAKEYVKSNVFNLDTATFTTSSYKAFVLLRRDYTLKDTAAGDSISEYWDNFAQIRGELTLDLGGFTLSQSANNTKNQSIFQASSKQWSTTSDGRGYVFPTTVNVKNGKLEIGKMAAIRYEVAASSNDLKVITFNFDDVIFGLREGATAANLLVQYATSLNYGGGLVVNVADNCVFDLQSVEPTSAITLVNAASPAAGKVNIHLNIGAAKILAGSLDKITISSAPTATSELHFNGTTLLTPAANTPYAKAIATSDGEAFFYKVGTDGDNAVYELASYDIPASKISENPGKYLAATEYPFAVYTVNADGTLTFKESYNDWVTAFNSARDIVAGTANADKTALIRLLADATTGNNTSANANFSNVGGTVIFDLMGHTLERSNTEYIFDLYGGNTITNTLIVRNGTWLTGVKPMIGLDHGPSVTGSAKHVNFTFENMTFGYVSGTAAGGRFCAPWDSGKGFGTEITMTFNDCTFDMRNAVAGATLIDAKDPSFKNGGSVDIAIRFNGGVMLAQDANKVNLFSLDDKDSAVFAKGSDGREFAIRQPASAAYPTLLANTPDGKQLSFYDEGSDGTAKIYRLGADIETPYGSIPGRYASVEDYPFAVFCNGKFVVATNLFGKDAVDSALHSSKASGSVILLRRDFVYSESAYNNLAQTYDMVFDLGGFTFTAQNTPFNAQKKTKYNTDITVKNGTIVLSANSLVRVSAWRGSGEQADYDNFGFTFTFDGVTIRLADKATVKSVLTYTVTNTYHKIFTDAIFNNCTFDLRGSTGNLILVDGNDQNNFTTVRAEINGGSILASSASKITFANLNEETGSTFFFGKGSDGYPTLILTEGEAPEEDFTAKGGETIYFAKAAEGYQMVELVWGNWTQTTAPTCTAPGVETHANVNDANRTETREVKPLGHDLVHHDGKDATCTEPGYKPYDTCTRCDYSTYETIPAKGHDLLHFNGKDATCTEPGYKPYDTCTRCDYSTYETVPAKGHTYGEWIAEIPATYESEGALGHYHCSVCEKNFDAEKKELSSLVIPKLEAVVRLSGVKQNITLTTELRTNVFFPQGEKKVTKVLYGDVELPLLQRTLDGITYDYVTVAVNAKDAAKEIALTVSFTFEGESYEQTIKANIPQYASLLAKHEEGKYASLANAILYYVKCADSSAAFEAVREEAQKAAAVNSIDASSPIKGASIYLGSSPVWVISLDTGYTGKIRYRFAGRTYQKEVAKQESLALDEIRLSDLTETISFSYTNADGAFVEAGSYNLSAYAEAVSENETIAALVDALYDYSVAAHRYIYGA